MDHRCHGILLFIKIQKRQRTHPTLLGSALYPAPGHSDIPQAISANTERNHLLKADDYYHLLEAIVITCLPLFILLFDWDNICFQLFLPTTIHRPFLSWSKLLSISFISSLRVFKPTSSDICENTKHLLPVDDHCPILKAFVIALLPLFILLFDWDKTLRQNTFFPNTSYRYKSSLLFLVNISIDQLFSKRTSISS